MYWVTWCEGVGITLVRLSRVLHAAAGVEETRASRHTRVTRRPNDQHTPSSMLAQHSTEILFLT